MVQRLEIDASQLSALTIEAVRNLVVQCFFEAQRETFSRAADRLGAPTSDEELRRMVEGAVRLSFRATGGDFDAPTIATLAAAVENLAARAASMGTPADIVAHHRQQLEKVFAALPAE